MSRQGLHIELLLKLWRICKNRYLGKFFRPLYRIYQFVLGVEIPWTVEVGTNLKISHPIGIIINERAKIGNNCIIRQNTTIGNKGYDNSAPVIGNNVEIGANCVIIGNITIGNNVVIGAGSIVVKSISDNCIVAGNPAKVIRLI